MLSYFLKILLFAENTMGNTIPEICNIGLYDASVVYKNKTSTPNRTVSFYEIEYVIEDGGVSYINEKQYKIQKNAIIVAKPGQIRHTELPFKALFIHIIIDNNEIASVLEKCPDFFIPENYEEYENAIRNVISVFTQNCIWKNIVITEKLFALFSLFARCNAMCDITTKEVPNNAALIKKAIDYMDCHFYENITLNDIANYVHLSRIYFRTIFVAATGITPYKYIRNKRLANAKMLILTTDKSFSQIATECGFSTQSYMNSVFRNEFSVTPKQFRETSSLSYLK